MKNILLNKNKIELVLKDYIDLSKLIAIYLSGSYLYGTSSDSSDVDLNIIYQGESFQVILKEYSLNFYSEKDFSEKIRSHQIEALEAIFSLPENKILYQKEPSFTLDLSSLRVSISSSSSRSYVKAKKKMTVEKDLNFYQGKKSLFHSFRILLFGIQIAKNGKITDFTQANFYWDKIKNLSDDWNIIEKELKMDHNRLSSEFRKIAPK